MHASGLLRRRARARAGVLAVFGALVATVAAVSGTVVVAAGTSATAAARDVLSSAPGAEGALVVRTRLGVDPQAQQRTFETALTHRFGDVPLTVHRSLVSPPVRLADDSVDRVVLVTPSDDGAAGLPPPPAAGEVLVPDGVATQLGLRVGDVLDLGATRVTVAATWPSDGSGAGRVDDPSLLSSAGAEALGPLLVAETTLLAVVDPPLVHWVVRPVVDEVHVASLPTLAQGSVGLEPALARVDGLAVRGLEVDGALGEAASRAGRAASTVRATGLVPVVLLAVVGVVALVQVVRLLVTDRTGEVGVLVARGADPGRLVRWAGVEAGLVAGAGALAGSVVAATATGHGGVPTDEPLVWAAALGTALVAVAATTVTTARQVRSLARVDPPAGRGGLRAAATLGTAVAVPGVALLASWRLLRAGGVTADGVTATDPLAVAAPAAVLVALALAGFALLGPAARAGEAMTARRPALVPALIARQVARRSGDHAVAVVLLVLAVGAVSVAAGYGASVVRHRADLAALDTGSDVRVLLPAESASRGADPTAASSAPFAALDGVSGAVTVVREQLVLGDRPVAFTALPTARIDEVLRAPVDLARTDLAGAPDDAVRPFVPAGSGALEVTARVVLTPDGGEAVVGPADLAVWLADVDGGLSRLALGSVDVAGTTAGAAEGGSVVLRADLPGPGPYRLAALDVATRTDAGRLEVEVSGLAATGSDGTVEVPLPAVPWVVADGVSTGVADAVPAGALGAAATLGDAPAGPSRGAAMVRVLPAGGDDGVPVAVSRALADRAALTPGARVRAALVGPEVSLRVVGLVDAVPGGLDAEALVADLDTLGHHLLQSRHTPVLPTEVWLAVDGADDGADDGATTAAVARAAGELVGPGGSATPVSTGTAEGPDPVVTGFWTVAGTAVVLALAGVAAVALALLRARRGEVVVLRAVGQTPVAQALARAGELLVVALLAGLVGAVAGVVTARVLVPPLVRSSVLAPGPLPVAFTVDVPGGAVLVAGLAVGLVVVATAVAARVRRQALDRTYREEVR